MATMSAAVLRRQAPIEEAPLEITDVPVPEPRPGEVLIRVRACAVCRTDLHVIEGDLPPRISPLIPGHQVVGVVERTGEVVDTPARGDRVGAAWLRSTCGDCRFCTTGRENLCEHAAFNGWTADGGYAEYMTAPARFVYPLDDALDDLHAAPLLCAGIIGYRCLRVTGLDRRQGGWRDKKLGIYGFGAAGHVAIQLARARGADAYICTRDRERHQALAAELGAAWIGDATDIPPDRLDASIIFAPAGEIVAPALEALDRAGVLVLGGIHMSPIPELEYPLIYGERVIRSVMNNTRADGLEFLDEAARVGVHTSIQPFTLDQANEALRALKHDAIKGAAVLRIAPDATG